MRPQKITFGEMRDDMGVRGVLVYCADFRCSHSVAMNADRWPDDVRLSDIEPRFRWVFAIRGPKSLTSIADVNLNDKLMLLQQVGRVLSRPRVGNVFDVAHGRKI
jgi:hypothetical protein